MYSDIVISISIILAVIDIILLAFYGSQKRRKWLYTVPVIIWLSTFVGIFTLSLLNVKLDYHYLSNYFHLFTTVNITYAIIIITEFDKYITKRIKIWKHSKTS